MLNVVALTGRLAFDPELRTTQSGVNTCTFRIAVDRNYVQQGEQRKADFFDVVTWRGLAEFVCKYFQKGSMIAVNGSLQTRQYQDKNGNSCTKTEIIADQMSFCGAKAAEKPPAQSFERQTKNHIQQANAAQNAPQGQQYAQGADEEFAPIDDGEDLPF